MFAFLKDQRGSTAPLLALAAIPIMATVGAAIDYSRAASARTAMQAAADSTALIIARNLTKQPGETAAALAPSYFAASFHRSEVQISQVGAATGASAGDKTVTVTAQGTIKTVIMRVVGISTVALNVTSNAVAKFDGFGCVLALDPGASGTFVGQGSTTVTLKGCSLFDNSKHAEALAVGGSAKVSALSVGVVGGIAPGSTGLTADNGIATGIPPVDDPYKDVTPATAGACTEQNFKTNVSVTLSPGVYCGGIAIHSGATVTLNPGTYYIDGGDLTVNGNAGLVGNGVTLVFTAVNRKAYGTAVFNGNATIDLTAPSFGATAGIVMFGDRNMPTNTTFKLNGGATQNFGGAVYLPKATIDFTGGNGSSAACTQLIGNKISFSGNSSLAINCSSHRTKEFGTWSIRITS